LWHATFYRLLPFFLPTEYGTCLVIHVASEGMGKQANM